MRLRLLMIIHGALEDEVYKHIKKYVYNYIMRIKKSEKYIIERDNLTKCAIEILQLDKDQSFILYEFDKDIHKQEKLLNYQLI